MGQGEIPHECMIHRFGDCALIGILKGSFRHFLVEEKLCKHCLAQLSRYKYTRKTTHQLCSERLIYPIHTTNRSEAKRTEAKRSEPYCRIRTIHTSTECAAMRIPQFASFHTAHSRMRFVSHWKRSEAKRTIECCYG